MTVVAPASKVSRQNAWIITIMCVALALWFLYDGWISQSFQDKHLVNKDKVSLKKFKEQSRQPDFQPDLQDFQPDVQLKFHRYWGPPICGALAVFFLIAALRARSRKVLCDDTGLTLANGQTIPYSKIKQIDKSFFEKEGHFTITCAQDVPVGKVKLSSRKYDNLAALLSEIISRTGAAPSAGQENTGEADRAQPPRNPQ